MPNGTDDNQLQLAFPGPGGGTRTAERFEEFHRDNPVVYRTLVTLARQWVDQTGRHKMGINALVERTRWEVAITTSDPDFKINNSYAPYYARVIMRDEPDLDGIFDLRRSAADEWLGAA